LKFVRKILTHGTRCKTSFSIARISPINVGIIFTSVGGIILTLVVTISTLVGIIPILYIMCSNILYKKFNSVEYNVALHM